MIKYRTVEYDCDEGEKFSEIIELRPGDSPDIPDGEAIDLFIGDLVLRVDVSEWGTVRCERIAAKPADDQKYISEKLLKYAYLAGVCRNWGKVWAVGYFAYARLFGQKAADRTTTAEVKALGEVVLKTGSFFFDEEVDWLHYDESGENRIR